MNQILWKSPVPATALDGCAFQKLPRHVCALACDYEDEDNDKVVTLKLVFAGVEAFKCSYDKACTPEMISTAYGKVVDVGSSQWLNAVRKQVATYGDQKVEELKHLMIYFDDGPCYEFICRTFRVEESSA